MKTLTATLTLLLVLVALPASADLTFNLTGTVNAAPVVADDGSGCSVPLRVATVAGEQVIHLSGFDARTCARISDLKTGQRVEARGALFANSLGTLVPVVEWIESHD